VGHIMGTRWNTCVDFDFVWEDGPVPETTK